MFKDNWILGSLKKDLLVFYLPGFLTILISYVFAFPKESTYFLVFAWIAVGLFDTGHVYTTVWRTYLNPQELNRKKKYYILMPLAIFSFFFLWMYMKVPYLGAFIAYFTIYHNLRQFYGMNKWYQKINKAFDSVSDKFMYTLCIIPVVVAHFRTDLQWTTYYSDSDVFMYPSLFYKNIFTLVYLLVFAAWVAYEFIKAHKQSKWEFARILAVLFPILTYTYCFMFATTVTGILFPLVVSHGLSYIVLVGLSVKRINPAKNYKLIGVYVFLTAVFFGGFELYLEEDFFELYSNSLMMMSLTSLLLTPLYCHYIYDAFLWRGDHPEAKVIIS